MVDTQKILTDECLKNKVLYRRMNTKNVGGNQWLKKLRKTRVSGNGERTNIG